MARRAEARGAGMISLAAMRRCGPWLLGLFLLAQIVGVAPLVTAHTIHVAGSIGADLHGDGAHADQAQHQHGDADSGPQHHALHDMTGVLADAPGAAAVGVAYVTIAAPPPNALAAVDPVLPERPPKSILSV
jgi:hypothetical protein